jgi:hypothetical protein
MTDSNRLRARARRALAWAGLTSLAAGLLLLPAAAHSAAAVSGKGTPRVSNDSSVTVTGPKLYDPATGKSFSQPSKVTVSQTSGLTDQLIHVSWGNFTPSQSGGQEYYQQTDYYGVMAAECRGTDPTTWSGCYEDDTHGLAEVSGPAGPPNAAYAITTAQGTGQLNILIETMLENSVLGCSQNQPCSLVIVPGQGGVPPLNGQPAQCPDHSADVGFAGTGWALASNTFFDTTGGCSWNDRIIIPLHFAPLPTGCPQRGVAFNVTGSPMMAVAMQQWLTGLCEGRNGMTIGYDSTLGEPTAVGDAVADAADENAPEATNVALTTQPASADGVSTGNTPFVYAPIAVSAASVAYWFDDNQNGQPMSGLKLDPRLLAKLLTTSYNPDIACTGPGQTNCDPGVDHGPFSILKDKEFKSLDPSFVKDITFTTAQTRLAPTVPFGASDITWTVTRWIAANSGATSFLKGTFDPWGTHVNTYYLNTQFPTNQFQSQDPNFPWQEEYSPVFPLSQAVTYQALSEDSGGIVPVPPPTGGFSKDPPEPVGNRMLIALLDQGDAAIDAFPTAAIENAAGDYVTPTNAAMGAAVSHMVSNGNGTLQMNLTNTDPQAYPLTMVIYAMVPTSGLPHAKATAIARFLDFAAGAGQTPGELPGELPNGYLPLPASMRAQTRKLAVEVADQTGNSRGHGSHRNGSQPGGGSSSQPSPGSSTAPSSPATSPATSPAGSHLVTLVDAHTGPPPLTRFILPALLILGALAALGGSSALAGAAEGGIAGGLRRLRRAATAPGRAARTLIAQSRPWHLRRRRKP